MNAKIRIRKKVLSLHGLHGLHSLHGLQSAWSAFWGDRYLTRAKLRTAGNLTQNLARPVEHLTFVSKRLSVVGCKRISQFFDSARERRSRVIALVDSTWVFPSLSFYIVNRGICLCLKCGAKTR